MAITGSSDINCPKCGRRIGSKQNSKTSGGASLVCTSCHIRVEVGFTRDGYTIKI